MRNIIRLYSCIGQHMALIMLVMLIGQADVWAQNSDNSRTSLKTGLGVGYNEGYREIGTGVVYSIGWQKSYGTQNRVRLNPNLVFGGFMPFGITDSRDQFYRISLLGLNVHYNLIQYKPFSLVTTTGGFINYSRGLIGTGGWSESDNIKWEYFYTLYFGVSASFALRIEPNNSKFAYEIRPLNLHLGQKDYILGYLMFGVDYKFRK